MIAIVRRSQVRSCSNSLPTTQYLFTITLHSPFTKPHANFLAISSERISCTVRAMMDLPERRKGACQRGMRNAERGTNDERRAWAEVVAAEDDAGVEERGTAFGRGGVPSRGFAALIPGL